MSKEEKQVTNLQAYNLLMEAPAIICILRGPQHVYEFANKMYMQLIGHRDLIGKTVREGLPELEGQGLYEILDNVYTTGKSFIGNEVPVKLNKGDGNYENGFFNFVYQASKDGNGNTDGILVHAVEITEQVSARKKVEESEERLRLATETTKLGTWEYLPLTGQLTWSDECKRIYAFPLDKKVDYELFSEHIYPEDTSFAQGAIEQAMDPSGNGSYDIEYRILRYTDKSVRWIRAQGKVFFNAEKKPVKFIGTVLDITDAKLKEEDLRGKEERLRLAVESGRLGTYELDMIKSSIIFSERLAEIFGLDPLKKGTHQDLKNALHPDDVHIRNEAHEIAKKTGSLFYEARVVWPDGSIHWIRLNGNVVFDKKGEALRTYGTALDITEQKEREKLLRESQKKFELIADAIPHMVWEIELDGTITYINKQWEDWSGLTIDEINNNGWTKVIHPDDLETIGKGWQKAFETKYIYVGECRFKNPDGGYSWFTLKTVPIKNDNGDVELWIGTATDIHDKKIIEQQKDGFISIASHELKTPVTTIKAYGQIAENMLEKKGDVETLAMIKKMGTQVNRLTTLIGDLLDVTKIQQGKLMYNEAFFDFNDLVKEVIDDMQRTSATHEIKKNLDTTAEIYGDKNKISQVLNNLISNAVKYSPKANRIFVCTHLQKDGIKLSVQDFGIGISAPEQKHVFEQFYRVNGDNQSTFPGLGIGLYICSEIIKRQGGKIWVESKIDRGSIFCIWLPFDHRNEINRL